MKVGHRIWLFIPAIAWIASGVSGCSLAEKYSAFESDKPKASLPAKIISAPGKARVPAGVTHLIYPDKNLTPGDVDPKATKEKVCTPNYSEKVRHVTQKTKKK